ncbi:LysM peptidoglycan-binding domain-containing protein [Bacillus pinisoli]|uniref:LysM peptidoglycan-binding domain-containing protein n=1 Tax=Bacillus pinisoli TaxID=2901866 RepID=UPI001FF269D8|nr:LysM peptidoglycan-binding domain-containing protein [Bacillus pinisoli]
MILRFTPKQIKVLMFAVIVIALIYTGIYLLFSSKWDSEQAVLSSSLQVEEQQVQQLQKKIEAVEEQTLSSTILLQEKLPVDPLVEQLILDLEKAETISDSFISSMSFSDGTFSVENTLEQYQQFLEKDQARSERSESLTEDKEESQEESTTEQSEQTKEETALTTLGLEQVEVTLNVESPTFFEMKEFLKQIELLPRIVRVKALTFAGIPELTSEDQTINTLKYTVVISTYYFPGLEDLKDELPPLETPEPSKKKNPFLPSTEEEQEVEESESSNTSSNSSTNVIEHTVQAGETLYLISQKYYQDRSGEKKIRDYNDLSSNYLVVGQVLKIPLD